MGRSAQFLDRPRPGAGSWELSNSGLFGVRFLGTGHVRHNVDTADARGDRSVAKNKTSAPPAPDGNQFIRQVLAAAEPRPERSESYHKKNAYAVRFADAAAVAMAADLAPRMRGIEASPKRVATSALGAKQLDVNFSTPATGLALGISLKSVHIRETTGAQRYTHNKKRNEEELRIEAIGYHKRQPYAVMVGVLFLPFDSCDDAKAGSSSFGSWVRHLRPYSGRQGPHDDVDRFEKIYIALYEPDGTDVRFFDVDCAPPKAGRPRRDGPLNGDSSPNLPRRALSYAEFLEAIHDAYTARNNVEFHWDDGTEDPVDEADDDDE